jgi:hypothetical protein
LKITPQSKGTLDFDVTVPTIVMDPKWWMTGTIPSMDVRVFLLIEELILSRLKITPQSKGTLEHPWME